jgi:hypothetical protein
MLGMETLPRRGKPFWKAVLTLLHAEAQQDYSAGSEEQLAWTIDPKGDCFHSSYYNHSEGD